MFRKLVLAATILSLGLPAAAAAATDEFLASMSWSLDFGGGKYRPALKLAAGLDERARPEPLGEVFALSLDRHSATAAFAGLPLAIRTFATRQDEIGEEEIPELESSTAVSTSPWYTESWVLWTGGGVVALGALAAAGGDDSDDNQCTGVCDEECTGNVLSTCNGQFCVSGDEGCLPANPVISFAAHGFSSERELASADERDATGGMGDLIARLDR